MPAGLKRTYSTRTAKPAPPSSPPSELTSPPPLKRKRPLADRLTGTNTPSKKPRRAPGASTSKAKAGDTSAATKPKQGKLTQLHFSLDTPTLRTCPLCDLSYTRGAPDDEALHKAHCARVQRGLEWGREEQREAEKAGVEELESSVKLPNGARGRIVCFRPDVGGKIGAKVREFAPVVYVGARWLTRCAAARDPAGHDPPRALVPTALACGPSTIEDIPLPSVYARHYYDAREDRRMRRCATHIHRHGHR